MKTRFQDFLNLHQQSEPLLVGNVWNAQSAKIFEQQNFKVIATSSAAVAESLGYTDGEEISLEEYLYVIKRIAASTSALLSVDFEGGYGKTPAQICENIEELYHMGVVGINIEDSIVVNGNRRITEATTFANKLKHITEILKTKNIDLFINVRSDCFLLGLPNALDEALLRTKLYEHTGIHGLFFPCITDIEEIKKITTYTKLPVNVMCMPNLPDFRQLQDAGVKRISIGPFLNTNVYQHMQRSIEQVVSNGSFESVF